MAILIVDDESSTRSALRDLLTQMGHKTILEAKNGEEALKTAETEKNRIRLIVADWEMPYMDGITLLGRIAALPELDLAPFLLITSDLPRAKLAELQTKTDRLDAFLIKPFRMSALAQAMDTAQVHRASLKRKIIALSADGQLPAKLPTDLASPAVAKIWDLPVICTSIAELQQAVQTHARQLGAVLITPQASGAGANYDALAQWLTTFVRTPLGAATPIVCAGRDPAAIFPLRTLCQAFIDVDSDWALFWTRLKKKQASSLELEMLFQDLKSELQKKGASEAGKICEKILALDPTNSEAHARLGDLLSDQKDAAGAVAHYWSALAVNPCQPKPYIRLLENVSPTSPDSARAATAAATHCPQNPDVLFAAARAAQASGNSSWSQELVRKILAINPNHAGAKDLFTPST